MYLASFRGRDVILGISQWEMPDCGWAFLVGLLGGAAVLFVALLFMGALDIDPDDWNGNGDNTRSP